MFRIGQAKRFFFDRPAVISALSRARLAAFSKIGAYIRRGARQLIKPSKSPTDVSKPGRPPLSHTGLLRENIFFVFDFDAQSVVIGPVALNGANHQGQTPRILEFGGVRRVRSHASELYGGTGTIPVLYLPRPFMGPALRTEIANRKLEGAWKDAFSGVRTSPGAASVAASEAA